MRKEELRENNCVSSKHEGVSFEEYLSVVTEDDCNDENFCKNFQTDPNWRHQFYILRKNSEKLDRESKEETWENVFKLREDNKKLSDDLEKLKKKFDFPDLLEVREQVLMLLLEKKRDKVTETIVEYIKSKSKIYTTRKDTGAQVYIYDKGIYVPNGETYIEEVCRLILQQSHSSSFITNVKDKIRADTYIDEDEFFKEDRDCIVVQNGILNIRNMYLSEYTDQKRFFSKIPVKYDSAAKCNKIIEFFKQIIEYEDDLTLIQELFGYLLYKSYPIEKAFMLMGKGRNGKGQFLELIKRFVGSDNCAGISLQKICDDTSFDLSELHKKLVNLGGDIPDTFIKETGIFKSLTGNDYVGVRRKYLNNLNFQNYAKMIFACNNLPKSNDNSQGFWSRWILLNFPWRFADPEEKALLSPEEQLRCKPRINEIASTLCDEEQLSGLLNWALIGLDSLLERGYFTYTTSNKNVQDRWIRAADSFAAFCSDNLQEEYGTFIMKDDLRKEYNAYCKMNKVEAVGDKAIKNYLTRELGATEWREQNIIMERMWKNISFKNGKNEGFDFGIVSTNQSLHNQGSQDNHGFSTSSDQKNLKKRCEKTLDKLSTLAKKKEENYTDIDNTISLTEKGKIIKTIEKIPTNNSDLLFDLFGEEVLKKMMQNGDIFLKDSNTYRVV